MSYDFPNNPTNNQEYTPPVGGQTYIYKAPRWLVKGIPPVGGGGSGSGIDEAPIDGQQYARQDAAWSEVIIPPSDWASIPGKPATFPPTLPIASSGVTGLDAAQTAQDTAIGTKLNSSVYTAADVLAKTITVDGPGSGLDADLLDGQQGAYYSAWTNLTGKPSTFPPTLPIAQSDVAGLTTALTSKLDVSAYTAADVLTKTLTVDGAGSSLDADLLDGQHGSFYSAWANLTGRPTTFPPTLPIAESDVTNLVTDLAAKLPDAPIDGKQYVRKDGGWVAVDTPFSLDVNGDVILKFGATTVIRVKSTGLILTKDDIEVFSVSV